MGQATGSCWGQKEDDWSSPSQTKNASKLRAISAHQQEKNKREAPAHAVALLCPFHSLRPDRAAWSFKTIYSQRGQALKLALCEEAKGQKA